MNIEVVSEVDSEVDLTAAEAEFFLDHGATGEAIGVNFELAVVVVVDDEIAVVSSTKF